MESNDGRLTKNRIKYAQAASRSKNTFAQFRAYPTQGTRLVSAQYCHNYMLLIHVMLAAAIPQTARQMGMHGVGRGGVLSQRK